MCTWITFIEKSIMVRFRHDLSHFEFPQVTKLSHLMFIHDWLFLVLVRTPLLFVCVVLLKALCFLYPSIVSVQVQMHKGNKENGFVFLFISIFCDKCQFLDHELSVLLVFSFFVFLWDHLYVYKERERPYTCNYSLTTEHTKCKSNQNFNTWKQTLFWVLVCVHFSSLKK